MNLETTILSQSNSLFLFSLFSYTYVRLSEIKKKKSKIIILVVLFLFGLIILFACINLGKAAAAATKSLQSCPTLCDPIDGSPPGSPVPGILQARTLEWVAISFSNA